MNAQAAGSVRILNSAIDETPSGEIVLRGVVDSSSLRLLKTDDYQREVAPLSSQDSIMTALRTGQTLPDIELGMRGEQYKSLKGDVHLLLDDVYIIDGLQRVSTAMHFLAINPENTVHLGAQIHFGTTKKWERERFRILNTLRSKVSPNVILRNKREESVAIAMLYKLCTEDRMFMLHTRVSWGQRMSRGELISALTLAKLVGLLHSHKAASRRNDIDDLVPALDKAVEIFGIQSVKENTKTFFDLIDECWGVRKIQYKEGAPHIKGTFLDVLARIVADHFDFWRQPDERRLVVEATLRRKLALFPLYDPQVSNLASAGGKARDLLYLLMVDHINSGKRTKRLRPRSPDIIDRGEADDAEEEDTINGDMIATV